MNSESASGSGKAPAVSGQRRADELALRVARRLAERAAR
jgi:hypothetical protein